MGIRLRDRAGWLPRGLAGLAVAAMAVSVAGGQDTEPPEAPAADAEAPFETGLLEMVRRLEPTVVRVEVSGQRSVAGGPRGEGTRPDMPEFYRLLERLFERRQGPGMESGAGTVIDHNGTVLTHAAVLAYGASSITVFTSDGRRFRGRVLGVDRQLDVGLLALDPAPRESLPAAVLGSSGSMRPGSFVVAFGNPFGVGRDAQPSVSFGVITARRQLDAEAAVYAGEVLQTDAAINPGNHGGPLVDLEGRVVGVIAPNVRSPRTAAVIGYAVPIDGVRLALDSLRSPGGPAGLGVLVRPGQGSTNGALIEGVVPGGAAERAGLKDGDVVYHFGGTPIRTADDLVTALNGKLAGQRVLIGVERDGWQRDVPVVLGGRSR